MNMGIYKTRTDIMRRRIRVFREMADFADPRSLQVDFGIIYVSVGDINQVALQDLFHYESLYPQYTQQPQK
jgi:hypothetical protein